VLTEEKLNKINATLKEYLGNPLATLHKRSEFHIQQHKLLQATATNPVQTTVATCNFYVQKKQELIGMSKLLQIFLRHILAWPFGLAIIRQHYSALKKENYKDKASPL